MPNESDAGSNSTPHTLPVENIRKTRPEHLTRGPFAVAKFLVDNFSGTGKRKPPSVVKRRHVRLITVGPSPYCEKARWALDLLDEDPQSEVYYTEDAHPPAFAAFATVPASHGEWSASPMIVSDDPTMTGGDGRKKVVFDSTRILRLFCPHLYPAKYADDILQFERHLGEKLGATSRCFVYHHFLTPEYFPLLTRLVTAHTSTIEAALFERMLPKGLAKGMRKAMTVNERSAEASLAAIRDVFEEISDMLDNGKNDYLFGSADENVGFTAADLTFAALASPLVNPPEMKEFFPQDERQLPPRLVELQRELRSTVAGKHALQMYKHHRFSVNRAPEVAAECKEHRIVVPKSIGRNRVPWVTGLCVGCAVTAIAFGADRLRRAKL